jgi:hypothetical protein
VTNGTKFRNALALFSISETVLLRSHIEGQCVDPERAPNAAILGTGDDEAIHCITDTMYAGAPYTTLSHLPRPTSKRRARS